MLQAILIIVFIVVPAIVLHEYAHGLAAYLLVNPTAKRLGRLTLNPIKHIDPVGSILVPGALFLAHYFGLTKSLMLFGWAKPVPVNFRNLSPQRLGMSLVAIAGPVTNIILAFIFSRLYILPALSDVAQICAWGVMFNLILAVFNMMPIPPLDGSRIVTSLLPTKLAFYYSRLEPFGIIILLVLLNIGMLGFLTPMIEHVANWIGGIVMISKVRVGLKNSPYTIAIGHGILGQLPQYIKGLDLGKDAVIISHSIIERLHGKVLSAGLKKAGYSFKFFNVPEGEKSKSAACAMQLLKTISAYDINKKTFIIALGGGVVGDLAGFVAAIYKRGVPYIQVPTTLLAQIDSSIGGKTAIDLETGKNLVGAFYQPRLVFTDTKVLKTLSVRQIRNGLAEAIKYGIINDPNLFFYIEANHQKFLKGDIKVLNFIVKRCAAIKAKIVSADEKETKGLRTVLNFGHTVGHAVEAAAQYNQYHHGESVGLGMRVAARISVATGLLSSSQENRINRLISSVGLPEKIKGVRLAKILDLMRHDKKFVSGRNRFVLARKIGQVTVVQDIPSNIITQAIQAYLL